MNRDFDDVSSAVACNGVKITIEPGESRCGYHELIVKASLGEQTICSKADATYSFTSNPDDFFHRINAMCKILIKKQVEK